MICLVFWGFYGAAVAGDNAGCNVSQLNTCHKTGQLQPPGRLTLAQGLLCFLYCFEGSGLMETTLCTQLCRRQRCARLDCN